MTTQKVQRRILFWGLILFFFTLTTHGKNSGQGDEPHYMMIAHSLLFDQDLAVENNYLDPTNIVYAGNLKPELHMRPGRDGVQYSVHSPGLPVLSLPVFAAGYKLGTSLSDSLLKKAHLTRWTTLRQILALGMMFLSAWGALLCYEYLLKSIDRSSAFLTVLICFLAVPLLPLSFLFFTEMPAAFLAFYAYSRMPESEFFGKQILPPALAVSYLPFLHVKYLALSGVLLLIILRRCLKSERRGRSMAIVLSIFVAAQVILAALNYYCWGSILPYAAYGRFELSISAYGHGLLGLFFDREFGLLTFSPIYVLAVVGGIQLWKRNRVELAELCAILLSVIGVMCGYPMWWGGWSPAARFLTPAVIFMLPLVAQAIHELRNSKPGGWIVTAFLTIQGALAVYFWQHPRLMWNHAIGESDLYGTVGGVFPSIILFTTNDLLLCIVWSLIFAGVVILCLFCNRKNFSSVR